MNFGRVGISRILGSQAYLLSDALLLGLLGAAGAWVFTAMLGFAESALLEGIAGVHPPGLPSEGGTSVQRVGPFGLWLVPVATTVGGLLSGWLVFTFAPEAEGHGTDAAVRSFHAGEPLRARVVPIKTLASAITIGSGGAAGREGPAALISAGLASLYAGWRGRSEDERRILLLVGMAAGLSAIFRSPVGAAIFAVEVLYRGNDFEARALIHTLLASVVAYTATGVVSGWEPIFSVPSDLGLDSTWSYASYGLLGLLAGLVAAGLPWCFYATRAVFGRLPGPVWLRPGLGGLAVGLLALVLPQVLGGGYGWIQDAIDGQLPLRLLALLVVAKTIAFSLTVGSGGSGGVFAPGLYVGAMLGGAVAATLSLPPAGLVIVGMAAVFAGAARTPIATLLMVTEMTGGYALLVPAALGVSLALVVQLAVTRRSPYPTLYEAQVEGRADSPAHHAEHIATALAILRGGHIAIDPGAALDLIVLLRAGIGLALPGGGRLVLRDAQAPGQDSPEQGSATAGQVLGFIRDDEFVAAAGSAPEPNDEVLVLEAPEGHAAD